MFKTEKEVTEILEATIHPLHSNTQIRAGKSTQKENTLSREVTFFIILPLSVDRDEVIKKLNELTIKYDRRLYFSGSEAGLLHGDIENDWFFITAEITQFL